MPDRDAQNETRREDRHQIATCHGNSDCARGQRIHEVRRKMFEDASQPENDKESGDRHEVGDALSVSTLAALVRGKDRKPWAPRRSWHCDLPRLTQDLRGHTIYQPNRILSREEGTGKLMESRQVAGFVLAVVCCALILLVALGSSGAAAGVLASTPALVAAGLGLPLVALALWRPGKRPGAQRSRNVSRLAAIAVAVLAIVAGVAFVTGKSGHPRGPVIQSTLLGGIGIPVGSPAPEFSLTDAYSRTITRSSLVAGRPGLIFFTTTYCLPCIEGLRALKQFQREVGSNRFHVLIVFVDPRERMADLQAYQARYTFPQAWYYALDTDDLLGKYRVRSLDTKFALDRQGIVRFVDIYPATTETWRTALAAVGIAR